MVVLRYLFCGWVMLKIIALAITFASGCSFGAGTLQSKHSSDLESRRIRRIAVLPPETVADGASGASSTASLATSRQAPVLQNDAPDILARQVYSAMASLPDWQIVSDTEVREVNQMRSGTDGVSRLRQVGEMVFADAVMVTRIQRYRERVGDEWGAKSPASVAFVLDLIDSRRGDIIWTARFDETQKALSENIFAIGDIGQRGVRWLSAEQLARDGVNKAVTQLHQILTRRPTS